jgi:hypothetical protein
MAQAVDKTGPAAEQTDAGQAVTATAGPRRSARRSKAKPQGASRRLQSQPPRTSQRYEPGALPSRPGSQRLATIR